MQVADITGGMYFRAEDTSGLREIYNEINAMEKSTVEVQVFNHYTELAVIFLIPAVLIILLEILLRNTIFRTNP
jgi:Ca-activated chloride channel family protein